MIKAHAQGYVKLVNNISYNNIREKNCNCGQQFVRKIVIKVHSYGIFEIGSSLYL